MDGDGLARVKVCVHNSTPVEPGEAEAMERGEALRSSLLSTHVIAEVDGGRFVSPLERDGEAGAAVAGCESENTWPVLAGEADETLLGAPIVLPDHPRMAPESLGNLFDNTEIEEALLLHVKTLSDTEREAIAAQDPAVTRDARAGRPRRRPRTSPPSTDASSYTTPTRTPSPATPTPVRSR